MSVVDVKIVMGTKNVGWNDCGVMTVALLKVCVVIDINHALGVRVPKVGLVRWPIVNHGFVDGVGSFIRENAGGEARDDPSSVADMTAFQNVGVDCHIDFLKEHVE